MLVPSSKNRKLPSLNPRPQKLNMTKNLDYSNIVNNQNFRDLLELTQWLKLIYDGNCEGSCSQSVVSEAEEEKIFWLPKEEILDSLKKERNFYFSKLREIEILLGKINLDEKIKDAFSCILQAKPENKNSILET